MMTNQHTPFKPVVLQVLPALHSGGVERGTVEIAKGLQQAGCTSLVASSGGALQSSLERLGVTHITLPLASKNPVTIYRNSFRLAEIIRRYNVNIVHARSRAPAWSALYAARRTGVKLVTTYHGTYSSQSAVKRWYNSVMTKADAVIAISSFIKDYILQQHPDVMAHKIEIIPRGVDGVVFDPATVSASRINKIHREWAVPDNAFVIMVPARLSRWKGQDIVVDALQHLPPDMAFCAVLVGNADAHNNYRAELATRIEKLGLQGKVLLVGECQDMPAAYMLADVVVSAATKPEAFGRVIVEAQAMGRMVIAAQHGGALETIEEGESGWFVPPSDPIALAKKITELAAMPTKERQRLSHQVRQQALQRFSSQQMVDKTLQLYQRLGFVV